MSVCRRLVLIASGAQPELPDLPDDAARAVLLDYRDRVTDLAVANAHRRGWWYSWLSSRDQFRCPLPGDLLWLARVEAWLADGRSHARLVCHEGALADSVYHRARRAGWSVSRPIEARLVWLARRCAALTATLVDVAKAAAVGSLVWWAARRHRPSPADLAGNDVLLIGWLDAGFLRPGDAKRGDTYFGPLATLLEEQGERVLHLGPVMASPEKIVAVTAAAVRAVGRRATIGHFLQLREIAAAVLAALSEQVRLPGADGRLLRRALARRVIYSAQARMIESAVTRALAANPSARVIHLYENLPWERAVDLAAKRAGRDVAGYLHCAVLPSHLTYWIEDREGGIRPQPDRIICTGPAARDVLLSLGRHDPKKVLPGMALRDSEPAIVAGRRDRPQRIGRVLVLLEALYKMVPFLRLLDRAASLAPEVAVVVRAHPGLPLDVLARAAGVSVGPGARLHPSTASGLKEAIAEADLVAYQGTTAALTAAAMGVPLLWFDGGLPFTDDPLFRCPAFKRVLRRPEDLPAAVAAFEAMSEADWQHQRETVRAYVEDYLRRPSPSALEDFLQP